MSESPEPFRSALARSAPLPVRTVGFSASALYPPGGAQEGSPFKGFPTWRYRVLKTALRLRPRRALSSAPGQNPTFIKNARKRKSLNLTNHIPVHSRLASDALFSSALSKSWVSNACANRVCLIEVDHWKPKIAHRLVEEFEFAGGLMNREDDFRRWLDSKPGRG